MSARWHGPEILLRVSRIRAASGHEQTLMATVSYVRFRG